MWVCIFAEEFQTSGLTWLSFMKKKRNYPENLTLKFLEFMSLYNSWYLTILTVFLSLNLIKHFKFSSQKSYYFLFKSTVVASIHSQQGQNVSHVPASCQLPGPPVHYHWLPTKRMQRLNSLKDKNIPKPPNHLCRNNFVSGFTLTLKFHLL